MFSSEIKLRVRYAETDKMGYAYYGNYAQYYEVARVEAFRSLGLSYKEYEDKGFMMPVLSLAINFYKPAYYDDLITVKIFLRELPLLKIRFNYEVVNEKNELLNEGETQLVFINKKTGKPCTPPVDFTKALAEFFQSET